MADRKITDLTALTTPASADVLPIVDVSEAAAADKNKKITVGELFKGVPDGTAAAPAIAFESDDGNGIFLSTTDTVGIATNGSSRMTVSTTAVTSTLPVIVPDGTVAAPSVAFTGSGTDTGFYSDAANTLAASTGGTNALYIDSSQRIGIGSTSPNSQLNVSATDNAAIELTATAGGPYRHYLRTQGNDLQVRASSGVIQFYNGNNDGLSSTERARIDNLGRLGLGTTTPGSYDSNADDFVIKGGDPGITLATDTTYGTINFADGTAAGDQYRGYIQYAHNVDKLFIGAGGSTGLVIDSSQRVGIGKTSVNSTFEIYHDTVPYIFLQNSTSGTSASDGFSILLSGSDTYINNRENGAMLFYNNGSERFRCDSSGRLLVGTSSSVAVDNAGTTFNSELQVAGSSASVTIARSVGSGNLFLARNQTVSDGSPLGFIGFQGGDGTDLIQGASIQAQVDGAPSSGSMPGRLVFSTSASASDSPTERMRIGSAGELLIGTTSLTSSNNTGVSFEPRTFGRVSIDCGSTDTGNLALQRFFNPNGQVGSITISGSATAYNTSSDYRLKENVVPLTGAADRVNQLQVRRFNFIADPDTTVDGFIAHEAQAVVPECVTGTKDEVDDDGNPVYQGIDQSKLVPLLTAALQEALAEIESLKARVTALEP